MPDNEKIVRMFPGFGLAETPKKPNQEVIKSLEECLEQAKAGEIIGVVIAKREHDGSGSYSYAGFLGMSVVGAMTCASVRLTKMDEL